MGVGGVSREDLATRVGRNLRAARTAAGISGEELGQVLGLEGQSARNAISQIERGRPSDLWRVAMLADRLGVTLDELVREQGPAGGVPGVMAQTTPAAS